MQTVALPVNVPTPKPTVVAIAAVQDAAFKGCAVNVAGTGVVGVAPPARSGMFGANGAAGPKVTAGTPEPPVTHPAPEGVPVSRADKCPGVLPVATWSVG